MRIGVMDYSCPVPLYKFKEARIFSGLPRGDDNFHWTMEMLSSHDDEMEMQRKFPQWNRQHSILTRPYQFARLLAKIAFSYVAAEYGLGGFTPLVVDIILGRSDDYFYTVGGSLDIQDAVPGGDHITDIKIFFRSLKRALLFVEVRLFSQIRTPTYHVVVGEIDFENLQHAAIFSKHRITGKIPVLGSKRHKAESFPVDTALFPYDFVSPVSSLKVSSKRDGCFSAANSLAFGYFLPTISAISTLSDSAILQPR